MSNAPDGSQKGRTTSGSPANPRSRFRRRALWLASLVVVAIVAALPGLADAQSSHHSDRFGYTVDIPQGWTQIPDDRIPQAYVDRLRELFAGGPDSSEARRAVAEHADLDLLVQKNPDANVGTPPVVIVLGFNLRDLDVPESGVDDFFRGAVGEAKRSRKEVREFDFDEGLSDPQKGEVLVDSTELQYVATSSTGRDTNATHRGIVWLKAGKTHGLMLIFTVPPDKWSATSAARQTLYSSFRLDDDQVAEDAQTSRKAYEIGKKAGRYGVLIGCPACGFLLLIVLGFVIYRLMQD